ncbi:MAG: response regulator, partial [Myxococcaceae bacterium]
NLLQNSAKFTGRGGRVTIALRREGPFSAISVKDTGVGIAPDLMPQLFAPFVQEKRTLARTEGGLGLGLALVKGLAELHGGSVTVASEGVGRGSEFVVRVPAAAEVTAPAGAKEKHADPGSRRVLVVDDNRDAAESLAELVELFGHHAELAFDGHGAVAKAQANPPDVILCDIGLPGMDGYEVARTLRADPALRGTRMFAVSGYAQPEDRKRAADSGFDGHVAKPPDPDEIERLIAR